MALVVKHSATSNWDIWIPSRISAKLLVRFKTFATKSAFFKGQNRSCVRASSKVSPAANWQIRFSFQGDCRIFFSVPTYVLHLSRRRFTMLGFNFGNFRVSNSIPNFLPDSGSVTTLNDVSSEDSSSSLTSAGILPSVEKWRRCWGCTADSSQEGFEGPSDDMEPKCPAWTPATLHIIPLVDLALDSPVLAMRRTSSFIMLKSQARTIDLDESHNIVDRDPRCWLAECT